MNSMWSVFSEPYLVLTLQPSTSGSRSRCTPSRDPSAPTVSCRRAILSISSMNTMPFCSALVSARALSSSSLMSLAASSSIMSLSASRTFTRRVLHFPFVDLTAREHFAQFRARVGVARLCGLVGGKPEVARLGQQGIEHALDGGTVRAVAHARELEFARHLDRHIGQFLDDGIDLAADVADLGEFGCLDLHERRLCQACQAARDLGLADAGRTDHEDVLGRDLLPQRFVHLHAPPAVTQCDGHRALGRGLTDDVLVEFLNDRLRGHGRNSSMTRLRLV